MNEWNPVTTKSASSAAAYLSTPNPSVPHSFLTLHYLFPPAQILFIPFQGQSFALRQFKKSTDKTPLLLFSSRSRVKPENNDIFGGKNEDRIMRRSNDKMIEKVGLHSQM